MSAISKQAFAQKPNGWNRLDTLFSKGKAGGTPQLLQIKNTIMEKYHS